MLDQKLEDRSLSYIETHYCRICLSGMLTQDDRSFCRCTGSHSYVHQSCLIEWIKKAKISQQANLTFSYCQVCKAKILLNTTNKYYLREPKLICHEVFCHQSYYNRAQGIFSVMILVIFLAAQAILIGINVGDNEIDNTVALAAAIGNSILLAVCFIYFVIGYVLGVNKEIVGVRGFIRMKQQTNKTEEKIA